MLWALRGLSTAVLFIGVLLLSDLPLLGGMLTVIGVLAVPAWWWWTSRREAAQPAPASQHSGTVYSRQSQSRKPNLPRHTNDLMSQRSDDRAVVPVRLVR
jgi:hypothetical protein